jgi:predicted dithiol-disulfide oxidoreductase (DUF899 family)
MSDCKRTQARSGVRHRLNEAHIVPRKIASLALIAAGAMSISGLTALAVKKFFLKPDRIIKQTKLEKTKMKVEATKPKTDKSEINPAKVVSRDEWLVARKDLLTREKELTRLRDEVSRHRRELPWVKIDKEYVFEGPDGKEPLTDLFDGRSQLLVYHFMLGRGWEEGCKSCSFLADHFDGANWHLPHRDVTFVVISRATLSEIQSYQKRMGWRFKWLSSHGTDFNVDYHVSFTEEDEKKGKVCYNYATQGSISDELPGLSVFYKDENGDVFHTYSTYARGLDILVGAYNLLDLVPKGRDENPDSTMDWVRRHDEY